jgi:DNA-directed RNA polymerase subunit RPC12/RpoP
MKITGFLAMDGMGDGILADAHGNNIAFSCSECDHPILAVALENQRGCDEEHPAVCKRCGAKYFLDVRSHMEKLYVHRL